MKIALVQEKGGAGKTSLSLSIAHTLDYNLISNDVSVYENTYPKAQVILDSELPIIEDTVYDFGGFSDVKTLAIIKTADIIIIPCYNDKDSIVKTILTMQKIENYIKPGSKFCIVATRLKKRKITKR